MLTFLSKIFKINSIQVAGIYQETDNERYSLLTFKKEKNKLKLIENKSFVSQKSFLESIDLKLPIVLAIDGKGVLNKGVPPPNNIGM